jgi:formylglycine-generating enzyme required for sulfatase activity
VTSATIVLDAGGAEIEMIAVPAGAFVMGSANAMFSEAPPHAVRIERSFWLARSPVSQAQWIAVTGDNPSEFRGDPDLPVDSVSYDVAADFCRRLGERCNQPTRLPSEAEWEYACRAGTTTDFFFGAWGPFNDESEIPWAAREALCDYAWFDLTSQDRTWPVATKTANPWGFRDMTGGLWEWCADVWHDSYDGAPTDGAAWMRGAETQPRRVQRGGAWDMNAFRCRSSYRSFDHHGFATSRFGLRVALG